MANRFKQANERVHPTESVTDLKTAGIFPANLEEDASAKEKKADDIHEPLEASVEVSTQSNEIKTPIVDQPQHNMSYATDAETYTTPLSVAQNSSYDVSFEMQSQKNTDNAQETNAISSMPAQPVQAGDTKRNVPNMFTRKSESKSIRKSLVLRPSSVKIAEDYCAQNGGSFNELIQILLDNFIEEYGL